MGSHGEPEAIRSHIYEPLAIVGCGMRLPGGIRDSQALWDFLAAGQEGRCRVPSERYNIDAFYGSKAGQICTEYGHYLRDIDLAEMDASFWQMSAKEMADMDPQQRLALEAVYECFQNAGAVDVKGANIGTYFGNFGEVCMYP